jgi:hypothetical protein
MIPSARDRIVGLAIHRVRVCGSHTRRLTLVACVLLVLWSLGRRAGEELRRSARRRDNWPGDGNARYVRSSGRCPRRGVGGASAGVRRFWDDELGTITIDKYLFGQVYIERPETIGGGNWSLSTSYQWVHPASLDGRDLDQLSDVRPRICATALDCTNSFTVPAYHLDLVTNQVTMAATYGVTNALEVNVILPILSSDFATRIISSPDEGDAAGVGDIVLHGKYTFLRQGPLILAMGLGLTLPTGNADNLRAPARC